MEKSRYVNTRFWRDSYIIELNTAEKLLFIYLIANDATKICGIYELPTQSIVIETGIEKEKILEILQKFSNDNKIFYFDGWVVIKNFLRYQTIKNQYIEKGIIKTFQEIPSRIWKKIKNSPELWQDIKDILNNSTDLKNALSSHTSMLEDSYRTPQESSGDLRRPIGDLQETYTTPTGDLQETSGDLRRPEILNSNLTESKLNSNLTEPNTNPPPENSQNNSEDGEADQKIEILKPKKIKPEDPTQEDIRLSELLRDIIKNKMPSAKEPNIISWARDMNKLRRIDKRTSRQIELIINFAQQDPFWQTNILSPEKLRKHFDRLVAGAMRGSGSGKIGTPEEVADIIKSVLKL